MNSTNRLRNNGGYADICEEHKTQAALKVFRCAIDKAVEKQDFDPKSIGITLSSYYIYSAKQLLVQDTATANNTDQALDRLYTTCSQDRYVQVNYYEKKIPEDQFTGELIQLAHWPKAVCYKVGVGVGISLLETAGGKVDFSYCYNSLGYRWFEWSPAVMDRGLGLGSVLHVNVGCFDRRQSTVLEKTYRVFKVLLWG